MDARTQKFAIPIAAVSIIIAALMAIPVGSMLGLMGPSVHAPITGNRAQIMDVGPRSVDYRYHDFFEVPFGEWWDMRWATTHREQVISYAYPTMFYWYSQPPGNIRIYSNMMLDVTGRNMSELNMNSNPEFLPFLGTARGGNAEIDWLMQYLTKAEMKRFPYATAGWEDGWVISLNGTTTMDKQAAMAVLNVTSAGYDDFANWWTNNEPRIESEYTDWLLYEGNVRLDIFNAYDYPLTPLAFDLTAQKVADKIVLSYDIVSWGMEMMMARWLHEAFMPTEHYLEDFNLHATIGPEKADVDITTEVAYGIYAYETTVIPAGKTHGDPCWVFQTYHQDFVQPSIKHPKSDFAPYKPCKYNNVAPGSLWYGKEMPYDYAPTAHNLSANETLVVEFPTGPQLFKEQACYPNGTPILDQGISPPNPYLRIVNRTANMTISNAEPMMSDNPEISPGSVSVDNVAGRLTYTGPIDMWTWSKDQTTHQFLADEWDRLGIIPYGMPYVEFTWEKPSEPARADHYAVSSMSSPVVAGEPVTIVVAIYDQDNNVFPSYDGTLNFTSTDVAAVLPGNYPFMVSDAGVHVFSNLTFGTAGLQDLMLVDTANSSITGEVLDIDVKAAPVADHFVLSGIPNVGVTTGEPVAFTVAVRDQYDDLFPSYHGTLHFTSTDAAAVLPGDYTFTTADAGVHVFSNLTFGTAGLQDLMLVDAADSSITGQVLDINVKAAAVADHFVLSGIPNVVGINTAQDLTVTVYDQYGELFVGYTGTIAFSSNRSGDVVLPSVTTVPAGESHVTIPGGVTFTSQGMFLVLANDTIVDTINGETTVQVELEAPLIDHFVVTGETELAPGACYDLRVEAVNQFGSTFQTYTGTVHFATNAPGGTYSLPPDTTFNLADNGVKMFAHAMMFSQMGTYEVNVSDTVITMASGLLPGIKVVKSPSIVYTAYDFFQEPWGEWYWNPKWRWTFYNQDYILSNATGQYVQLRDPTKTGDQGVIYAPYRFNMTATDVINVDVHHPEFMPVSATAGPQAGAEVEMHIRMQYLDNAWWWSYWVPQFGWNNAMYKAYLNNTNDGYLLGVVYDVELNREAAYEWMGMPIAADPLTWWAANGAAYRSDWDKWINNEGSVRLDIFCGYEFKYGTEKLHMNVTEDSDGDILLRISTVSWGYEVLMTRWLSETQLCTHQPMFEDFDLQADYGSGVTNVTFDAVAQYGFHAVKANASATNDGAWVWEPTRIDYWPSWSQSPAYHPSEYDPYAGPSWGGSTTYRSWNSGDPKFGREVEYSSTPHMFNLNEFQTLVVKLPNGSNVPGYLGQGVGPNAIINMSVGDTHDYDALRYTGTASLGYVVTNPANPLDIPSLYDPITKTLTITGPYDFNNAGGRTGGMLYHGAPWIEFNVSSGTSPPIADAGSDQLVSVGDIVTFDGSASWDDVLIVNYTWTFWYNGSFKQLYGVSPTFVFLTEGVYNVTLTVRDGANQSSTAVVWITVEVEIPEFGPVFVPVVGLAMFVVITVGARRRRK